MTNPTDIPMNWQSGAEGMAAAQQQDEIQNALSVLEQNEAEIQEAFKNGDIDQETYDKLSEALGTMREQLERGEMPELPFDPTEPVPAILGMVAANMVSIYTPMGASLWTVDDPQRLTAIMGRCVIPRTMSPASGLREVGLLTLADGTLLVAERVSQDIVDNPSKATWANNPNVTEPMQGDTTPEGEPVYVCTHTFHLSEPTETEENPWLDVESFLRRIASENPERGEYAIVQKASDLDQQEEGQEYPNHYVLFGEFPAQEGDGNQAIVETFPHPENVQFWENVDKPEMGPTIVAAAANTDLADQGSIATVAIASWGINPWDIVVSYAPVPPRPGTPEAEQWKQALEAAEAARLAAQQDEQPE